MKPLLMAAVALAGLVFLQGCKPENDGTLPPVGQARTDMLHASCIKGGGDFVRQGKGGGFYCLSRPKDAGKSCSTSDDCESACLARSRSCAPLKPLLGCNPILSAAGIEETQCID